MKTTILSLLILIFSMEILSAQDKNLSVEIKFNAETKFVSVQLTNLGNDTIFFFNGDPISEIIEHSYLSVSEYEKDIYRDYEEKFPLFEYDHAKQEYKKYQMILYIPPHKTLVLEKNMKSQTNLLSKKKLLITVHLIQYDQNGRRVGMPTYKQWVNL